MTTKVAVSVAEAAELLSIGPRSVYRAVKSGTLPHLLFGKRIVIPVEALRAYARDTYRPSTKPANGRGREDAAE